MKAQDSFTVTLIGADGSGKSTVLGVLPQRLSRPSSVLYMGVSTSSSNRMLPTTRLYHALKRTTNRQYEEQGPPDPNRRKSQSRNPLKRLLKGLRQSIHYLILVSEEWYRQLISWWLLRRGRIMLYDRHFFIDYYAYDISQPRGFWQYFHGRMLARFYPRPQLVIFLDAPAEVLFARKGEGTIELLERRRSDYMALAEVLPSFHIVDATQSLDQVIGQVVEIIENYRPECRV